MASLHDVRGAFETEIESYIGRLEQKARRYSASSSDVPEEPASYHMEQVVAMRRLATAMMDSVIARLDEDSASWTLDDSCKQVDVNEAVATADAEKRRAAMTKCKELEALLRQKKEEEARLQAEVANKIKAEYQDRLEASAEQLRQALDGAVAMVEPTSPDFTADCKHVQQNFAQCAEGVKDNIVVASDLVGELESKKRELQNAAELLQKGNSLGHLFASPSPYHRSLHLLDDEEEDEALIDAVMRCKQASQMLRQHEAHSKEDL